MLTYRTVHVPCSEWSGRVTWPTRVPAWSSPDASWSTAEAVCCDGLISVTMFIEFHDAESRKIPDRSSVARTVTVTVAGPVDVSTGPGLMATERMRGALASSAPV